MTKLCANISPVNIPQNWYIEKYQIPQNRWFKLLSCYVKYSFDIECRYPSFYIFSQEETIKSCEEALKNTSEFLGYLCCLPVIYEDDFWRYEDVEMGCTNSFLLPVSNIVIKNKNDFLDVLEPYNRAHKLYCNGDFIASLEQSKRVFEVIFKKERKISIEEETAVKAFMATIKTPQKPKEKKYFEAQTLFTKLFLLKRRYAKDSVDKYIPSDRDLYMVCNLRHNQDHMNKGNRKKDIDCEKESMELFYMANELISLVFLDSSYKEIKIGKWYWKNITD